MQNANGWLVLHDRDNLTITIHTLSIQKVFKHYIEAHSRSYFCYGDDCAFCEDGIHRHTRYIIDITFRGETLKWEVNELLHQLIRRLPAEKGLARAIVTRSGRGKNTRYQLRNPSEKCLSSRANKYTSGRYGHLVQR